MYGGYRKMRLKSYLLREARVETTNADVYLQNFAPIFLYRPEIGLLWAVNPTMKSNEWDLYKNGRFVKKKKSFYNGGKAFVHGYLATEFGEENDDEFIKGRINPNGKEIYVHDLESRYHIGMDEKVYKRMVNKAVDKVYKYMGDYIK